MKKGETTANFLIFVLDLRGVECSWECGRGLERDLVFFLLLLPLLTAHSHCVAVSAVVSAVVCVVSMLFLPLHDVVSMLFLCCLCCCYYDHQFKQE